MAVSEKLTTLCLLASLFASPAAALDTTRNPSSESTESSPSEKHLQEVVVTADRGWVEDGKIIFLPSKTEKNLSNSPASLIESMHLPMLIVKDNTITSLSGQPVAIYINGIPADKTDLATFWPKLAKRVEYLENPAEGKYRGNAHVINFVMAEYAVGGVSKGDIGLKTPRYGSFSAASKLVYKKMSFGASVLGNSWKEDRDSRQVESFKNLYYDGTHHDLITRDLDKTTSEHSRYLEAAINARFKNGSFIATHTASLQFSKTPRIEDNGTDIWSPTLFPGTNSYNDQRSKSFSPQIRGDYEKQIDEKWFLAGDWTYAHSHNTGTSVSITGDTPPIWNSSIEEVNSLKINLTPTFTPNNKLSFNLNFNGSFEWFDTRYSGSATGRNKITRRDIAAEFRTYWNPTSKLSVSFLPGVSFSEWTVGDIKERITYPKLNLDLSWSPNRKTSIWGQAILYNIPPSTSVTNPFLTRQSELIWLRGNPKTEDQLSFQATVSASYLANQWLQLTALTWHSRSSGANVFDYTAMPEQQGGLLKAPFNAGVEETCSATLRGRLFLFNRSLSISFGPNYFHYKMPRGHFEKLNSFGFDADVSYTLNNCRFSLRYYKPGKSIGEAGMEKTQWRDNCLFRFTYGNGNLLVNFNVEDIFNTRTRHWSEFHSGSYSRETYEYLTGRKFYMGLSYTIGYGKKVDQSIDISGPESISSSVLK